MKKIFISLIFFFCLGVSGYSQDLKAGEIIINNISTNTFEINIYLYQNIPTLVNRNYIIISLGDGTSDTLPQNGFGIVDFNTAASKFTGTHTYIGNGMYIIKCDVGFRMANIVNITNSINENLHLEYHLNIDPFLGMNSSPVTTYPGSHLFWQCCNWINNSGFYDSDGDSLSYELVSPFTGNYTFPPAHIDSITGDLTFYPVATGLYAICMRIDEWRNLVLIGSTFRQMQIDVDSLISVDENDFNNKVVVYPNPAYQTTSIEFYNKYDNYTLTLFDIYGQLINTIADIKGNKIEINRNNLASGLYFFRLSSGSQFFAAGKLIFE